MEDNEDDYDLSAKFEYAIKRIRNVKFISIVSPQKKQRKILDDDTFYHRFNFDEDDNVYHGSGDEWRMMTVSRYAKKEIRKK